MVEFHCLNPVALDRFLARRRARPSFHLNLSLVENLTEVLRKANEFVPSEAGSILLDNPSEKHRDRKKNTLTFIASFGKKSEWFLGQQLTADQGIAGHVYLTGKAYFSADVRSDSLFYPGFDKKTTYKTHSLIAIPIRIEDEVCGVLELINRKRTKSYSRQDKDLLEIFADYISISIQNVLDGRQAQEIAKRDNLTGLYNDRFLHITLTDSLTTSLQDGYDLALLFLDLDFFKRVNDTHGHLAGSQVLREVGELLRQVSEACEAIPARYGGDEFVLVAPRHSLDDAVNLAEQLRDLIRTSTFCDKPGEIQPEPLHLKGITCSIGVATLKRHLAQQEGPSVSQAKSTLLRLADAAMYVAKETGRNRTAVAGEPVPRR